MKRFVAILLTALMMLSLLTACTAEQSPTDEPAVPKTAEEAASSEPAAESAEPETVTLHLFHQKQETQETFAKIIEEFEKEYPYITIEQEIVTNDPAAVLRARLATDEVPDIFQGALDTMDIAKGGYILDISGEPFLDNINAAAVSSSSFTDADGHTWALPIDGSCICVFYNKDIFNRYGLTPPTTLDEFDTLLSTLRENNVTAFALGFKDAWTIKPASLCLASPAVYAKYATWDADKTAGNTSFAETPEWTVVFEQLKKIYENGNTKTAFDTDYNGACAMIAQGEAAMMANGLWTLEPIRSINPDVNLGIMALPVSDNPADTKLHQFPDFGLSISASTPHAEECKLFFEFLTRKEIAEMWSNSAKLFSAVKGVSVNFDPVAADVTDYINKGMVCTQADRGWPTAFHAEYEASLPNYILGHTTIEKTMETLDAAWDAAVKAAG